MGKKCILCDIGTGLGGDVSKWKDAKAIYCIEPNGSQLEESLIKRIGRKINIKIEPVRLSNLDIEKIDRKINVFSLFFCMNQFEERDFEMLRKLVNQKSSRKCRAIGTFLDSSRLKLPMENRIVSIHTHKEKGHPWIETTIYGSHVEKVIERPLHPQWVKTFWKELGFTQIQFSPIEAPQATTPEQHLSRCFSMFMFKKK